MECQPVGNGFSIATSQRNLRPPCVRPRLQHVLVMHAGAIAVPLIVGRALKLGPEQVAVLISADLFACGIVTLIQSFGVTRYFGIKLPVMMDVTFAAVGPMVVFTTVMPRVDGARASASDREYSTPTDLVR